jgi:hypothetical protein
MVCGKRWTSAVVLVTTCAAGAQDAVGAQRRRWEDGGDLDKIVWHRPFARAQELARASGRVLLVKPILGGGNKPDPAGVPCGGKHDCEGSW